LSKQNEMDVSIYNLIINCYGWQIIYSWFIKIKKIKYWIKRKYNK
jgi:hypothetical protein